jgi:hypothetical protein
MLAIGPVVALAALAASAPAATTALSASVTVKARGTVTADGLVKVAGTVRCTGASGPASASLEILLDQREGESNASESATQVSVPCSPVRTRWTALLGSFTTTPFSLGTAQEHVSLAACDDVTCVFPDRVDATVSLRRAR